MTDYATITVSADTVLNAETTTSISFRPGRPGHISIQSAPVGSSKPQSATGLLGTLEILLPNGTAPVPIVKAPIADKSMTIGYTATAADLAINGDWTCRVGNETDNLLTFRTEITYVSSYPVQTASVDIPFLDLLLAEVANDAQAKVHLQTSPADMDPTDPAYKASWITISPDLATAIHQPSKYLFHVDDFGVPVTNELLKLLAGIGVLPKTLLFRAVGEGVFSIPPPVLDPSALTIGVGLDLGTAVLTCVNFGSVSAELRSVHIDVEVGMDGTIGATYRASLYLGTRHITDISSSAPSVQSAGGMLAPSTLQGYIQSFFTSFMRLNDCPPPATMVAGFDYDAKILNFSASGNSLVVDFYSLPFKAVTTLS